MNNQEKWIKWEPIQGIIPGFYEECVGDCKEGFIIILRSTKTNDKKDLRVRWSHFVVSYTVTNETYMDTIFSDLRLRDVTYKGGTLFKIENSDYLKRLSYSSGTLTDYMDLTHFVIVTIDSIIEVVADYEPEVEFI